MSKLFDIRTKAEAPQTASAPENPTIEWLKTNRHLFGPFKPGTVIEQVGDSYRAVDIPQELTKVTPEQLKVMAEKPDEDKINRHIKPVEIPKPVNYRDLPEDKKRAIEEANALAAEKLFQAGLKSQAAPEVIPQPQQDIPKNAGLPADIADGPDIKAFMKNVEERQATLAQDQPKDVNELPSAGGMEEPTHCQHCGWERSRPDPENPSELDKLNFIQSVLGQISFKKSYDLLNGRVQVVFRTLSSSESDMAFTQVAYDVGRGEVLDEGQYFRTITDYRMCMGLSALKSGSEAIELPDSVADWQTDGVPAKATKLIHIVPVIYERVLRTEPIRRAVAACFFRFQRLVERMEAHFDDPNFWPAIERQS